MERLSEAGGRRSAPPPAHDHDGRERRAFAAFLITFLFMLVEAAGGVISGSLALLADAAHMLTDSGALFFAWVAFRLGRMPADSRRSYGYRRLEVLAAMGNGLAVVGLAVWIVWEAAQRLNAPVAVEGPVMLTVAAAGLAVNLLVLRVLHAGHAHDDLNTEAAILHVLGDLLGSVAAVAAALVILWWGWMPIDPLLSMAVAALILVNAWRLVRAATHILLEGTPEGFDEAHLRERLLAVVPGLRDIHHVHAWSLTGGRPLVTLHALVASEVEAAPALAAIKGELDGHFGIGHSVVQIEVGHCPDHVADCA